MHKERFAGFSSKWQLMDGKVSVSCCCIHCVTVAQKMNVTSSVIWVFVSPHCMLWLILQMCPPPPSEESSGSVGDDRYFSVWHSTQRPITGSLHLSPVMPVSSAESQVQVWQQVRGRPLRPSFLWHSRSSVRADMWGKELWHRVSASSCFLSAQVRRQSHSGRWAFWWTSLSKKQCSFLACLRFWNEPCSLLWHWYPVTVKVRQVLLSKQIDNTFFFLEGEQFDF